MEKELIKKLKVVPSSAYAVRVLSVQEKDELISAACFMYVRKEELARQFTNQERYVMLFVDIVSRYVALLVDSCPTVHAWSRPREPW